MRIECTEGVVVNNIIGSFIKQQPTIEKLGVHFANRKLYTITLRDSILWQQSIQDFGKSLECTFLHP